MKAGAAPHDPAGLIASENLSSAIASLEGATYANELAMDAAQTADASIGQVSDLLLDAKSLAVASANSAGLSDAERAANQLEMDSIRSSIARISASTRLPDSTDLPSDVSAANVDATISAAAFARGGVGALVKYTLATSLEQNQIAREQLISARSDIRDADVAAEAAARNRALIFRAVSGLTSSSQFQTRGLLDLIA